MALNFHLRPADLTRLHSSPEGEGSGVGGCAGLSISPFEHSLPPARPPSLDPSPSRGKGRTSKAFA